MFSQLLPLAALVALTNAHGVILAAQGEPGSPPSVGFRVSDAIARNCTQINPCQQDTTIIRDEEIAAGVVNSCGRTKLTGNIDVGEVTENALAAGAVTQVKAGTKLTVTIHQVNADGAGPYFCDLDEGSNSGIMSKNLTVTNNVPGSNGLSQAQAQDFNITVELPTDMRCIGASTGNVCTVRCRNNALAGPFGGCFAVQQIDVEPFNVAHTPGEVKTAETLEEVDFQMINNQAALPAAIEANKKAGTSEQAKNLAAVEAILGLTTTSASFPTLTPTIAQKGAATSTISSAAAATTTTSGRGRNRGNGRNNNNNNSANANTEETDATMENGNGSGNRFGQFGKRAFSFWG